MLLFMRRVTEDFSFGSPNESGMQVDFLSTLDNCFYIFPVNIFFVVSYSLHYVYKQQKCVRIRPLYIIGRNSSDITLFCKEQI